MTACKGNVEAGMTCCRLVCEVREANTSRSAMCTVQRSRRRLNQDAGC